jgi:hypothetical protein
MTQLNHTNSRNDLSDAVVAAYIHEISARHASSSSVGGTSPGSERGATDHSKRARPRPAETGLRTARRVAETHPDQRRLLHASRGLARPSA